MKTGQPKSVNYQIRAIRNEIVELEKERVRLKELAEILQSITGFKKAEDLDKRNRAVSFLDEEIRKKSKKIDSKSLEDERFRKSIALIEGILKWVPWVFLLVFSGFANFHLYTLRDATLGIMLVVVFLLILARNNLALSFVKYLALLLIPVFLFALIRLIPHLWNLVSKWVDEMTFLGLLFAVLVPVLAVKVTGEKKNEN